MTKIEILDEIESQIDKTIAGKSPQGNVVVAERESFEKAIAICERMKRIAPESDPRNPDKGRKRLFFYYLPKKNKMDKR